MTYIEDFKTYAEGSTEQREKLMCFAISNVHPEAYIAGEKEDT